VGLTTGEPGARSGEPQRFRPSGQRTFARLVPRDRYQAAALLELMAGDGCRTVAVAQDGGVDGAGLARLVALQAQRAGVRVVGRGGRAGEQVEPGAAGRRALVDRLRAVEPDCFLFAGAMAAGVARLYRDVGAALPAAGLYGADGVCERRLVDPALGGVPSSIGRRLQCTAAPVDVASRADAAGFRRAYRARYGDARPDPHAAYGYEAARLLVDTLARLGRQATDRAAVVRALLATRSRRSAIGTYSLDADGDTSTTAYGVYRAGAHGTLTFARAIR
jgi:branched-chain amino acid transport system substrate-binding protein